MVITVRDALVVALETSTAFKSVTVGVVPPPSKIKQFPALAVDIVETKLERRSGCSFWANSTVDVYVYNRVTNRQKNTTDILNLVEEVDRALQTDVALNDIVTDVYVSNILSDGGISHPIEVYRVSVYLTYLTDNDYNK